MASLPSLLPAPPASLELRDTDAVESRAPKWHRPQEPDASGSRCREPNSPPSSRRPAGRSPPPSRVRRRSRSPSPSRFRRRSRSPSPSRVRRRSRSPPPSQVRRRSRSPSQVRRRSRSQSPSRVRRRSRSPSPSRVRQRSRSPPPSKVRRRSRSPSQVRSGSRSRLPSKVRRRSRSPPPSRVRHGSRSPSPSNVRRRLRSRSRSPSRVRRQSRSPLRSKVRCRSRSPPRSKVWRRSRSPRTSKVRRRSRSPHISFTQRLGEPLHDKRASAEAALEGERARSSSLDDSSVENCPSHSHSNCKHPETSSASEDEQKLDSEQMDRKNQSDDKAPSRNARRKKMKRQRWAEAKKGMSEAPSKNGRRRRMKRGIWAEAKKEFREMKKGKLLENIKKLQACILLLEKDGADMAEIMEFRSLLESTKKQYVENEAQLAKEGSSAPLQVLKRDRHENSVEGDEQNMDSGKVEAVSEQNELAEEVNHLKTELETVRRDRDYQLAQTQSLMADVAKQKEVARIYGVELEDAMRRVAALEEGCLLRRETIKVLQIQLASTNEKLTVPPPTID